MTRKIKQISMTWGFNPMRTFNTFEDQIKHEDAVQLTKNIWSLESWTAEEVQRIQPDIHLYIESLFEECVYQIEGPDEKAQYIHFQMSGTTIKRQTLWEHIEELQKMLPGIHVEPTREYKKSLNYCKKNDTRIAGPWYIGEKLIYGDEKENYEPTGDDVVKVLFPWQKMVRNMYVKGIGNRRSIFVLDPKGNKGKSALVKYGSFHDKALVLGWAKSSDLVEAIYRTPIDKRKIIFFDLAKSKPSGVTKSDIYNVIEGCKDGHLFRTKWESGPVDWPPSQVVVFTNDKNDKKYLADSRWETVDISDQPDAVPQKRKRTEFDNMEALLEAAAREHKELMQKGAFEIKDGMEEVKTMNGVVVPPPQKRQINLIDDMYKGIGDLRLHQRSIDVNGDIKRSYYEVLQNPEEYL